MVWLVTNSNLSFTKSKTDRTRTHIIFVIDVEDEQTRLRFTHQGLQPGIECYNGCSNGWENLFKKDC
ncbi:MAG: SRPBCC domain-containing protein [Bacteroidetes bacterium]|nr:SRPBCC domain-containing protein [Bacteroidota bacterium]